MRDRFRDRWERWLRAALASLELPEDVSTAEVWAVASMLATYGDADGTGIEPSIETVRRQLRIGKPKARIIADWLDESGVLVVVTKHGRDTATRRALAIPGQGGRSDDGTTCGPVSPGDDGTTCGPINSAMTGPKTAMTGPGTTNDGTERPYDGTALRSQTTDHYRPDRPRAQARASEATRNGRPLPAWLETTVALVSERLTAATGRTYEPGDIAETVRGVLRGKAVTNPSAYVRKCADENPLQFEPTPGPPRYRREDHQ